MEVKLSKYYKTCRLSITNRIKSVTFSDIINKFYINKIKYFIPLKMYMINIFIFT